MTVHLPSFANDSHTCTHTHILAKVTPIATWVTGLLLPTESDGMAPRRCRGEGGEEQDGRTRVGRGTS